jgi:hypothetical protein
MLAELKFDAAAHRYTLGGKILPSVTQVLQLLDQFEDVPPAVLEEARRRGEHVHAVTELDDRGELDEASVNHALAPYLEAWRRFRRDSGFVPTRIEDRVVHRHLGYAGTLDRLGTLRGRPALVDIKSGLKPKSVGAQTAAYLEAWMLNSGARRRPVRYCVQLNPDGYRLHVLDDPADWPLFISCLNLHNWRSRNVA